MFALIKQKFSRIAYLTPDWFFALLLTLLGCLHPYRDCELIISRKNCWMTKSRNKTIPVFMPKKGRYGRSNRKILEKYTYSPFVEVKEGDVVCDVGAFIGEYTLSVADKARLVISIEPDPRNYLFLKRNTEHLKNIILIPNPLWNDDVKIEFKLGDDPTDSSAINADCGIEAGSLFVQAKRLDTLLAELRIGKVDLLKIDAEGAEPEVLMGAEEVLTKIKKVAVDVGQERYGKSTAAMVRKTLKNKGFKTYLRGYMVYGWRD